MGIVLCSHFHFVAFFVTVFGSGCLFAQVIKFGVGTEWFVFEEI